MDRKEYRRQWYVNNRTHILLKEKQRYIQQREEKLQYQKEYKMNNKEKCKQYNRRRGKCTICGSNIYKKEGLCWPCHVKFHIPWNKGKMIVMPKRRLDVWNNKQQIIDKYINGRLPASKIAKEYNCDKSIIYKILKRNNVQIKRYNPMYDKKDEIITLYSIRKWPISKIAKVMHFSHKPIKRMLEKEGIEVRSRLFYIKDTMFKQKYYLDEDKIVTLYPKLSVRKLARTYHCNEKVIYRVLNKYNIPHKDCGFFNRGKHSSPQTEYKKGEVSLENHPNWKGGISFEPYGLDFNSTFRELIRKRDNHQCTVCNKSEKELNKRLSIHHIDYNKLNNFKENCVSLCTSCHTITNYNRESWKVYFRKLLFERYGYTYEQEQTALSNFGRVTGENLVY